ncbi:protein of unknown function (plasmid) [Cupriavidus taiwanensis]|nr:hypothetical protein CBM2621_B150028 [Cupriavidus taiwanensis]SPD57485.1 protein of unknown function [Cupriavidus taiwanensis]
MKSIASTTPGNMSTVKTTQNSSRGPRLRATAGLAAGRSVLRRHDCPELKELASNLRDRTSAGSTIDRTGAVAAGKLERRQRVGSPPEVKTLQSECGRGQIQAATRIDGNPVTDRRGWSEPYLPLLQATETHGRSLGAKNDRPRFGVEPRHLTGSESANFLPID